MIINIFFPTKEFARLNLILKIRPRSTRKMAANCIGSQQQQRPLFNTLLTVLLEPNFPETYKVYFVDVTSLFRTERSQPSLKRMQEMMGYLPLHEKTGNSGQKIKWFALFRLGWEASENMGCELRGCNFSTLFGLFS